MKIKSGWKRQFMFCWMVGLNTTKTQNIPIYKVWFPKQLWNIYTISKGMAGIQTKCPIKRASKSIFLLLQLIYFLKLRGNCNLLQKSMVLDKSRQKLYNHSWLSIITKLFKRFTYKNTILVPVQLSKNRPQFFFSKTIQKFMLHIKSLFLLKI